MERGVFLRSTKVLCVCVCVCLCVCVCARERACERGGRGDRVCVCVCVVKTQAPGNTGVRLQLYSRPRGKLQTPQGPSNKSKALWGEAHSITNSIHVTHTVPLFQ